MKAMTYPQVRAEFEALIAEDPTRSYPSAAATLCLYVHRDPDGPLVPGCLIGLWLHEVHQAPLTTLQRWEGQSASDVCRYLRIRLDKDAAAFVDRLQDFQDGGMLWAVAVKSTAQYMQDLEDSAAVARNLAELEALIDVGP